MHTKTWKGIYQHVVKNVAKNSNFNSCWAYIPQPCINRGVLYPAKFHTEKPQCVTTPCLNKKQAKLFFL